MSSVTASIGINSISSGVITKVTTSKKVETKVLQDFSGAFSDAATFDPTGEFTIEGAGEYPSVTLGLASGSGVSIPSTISGGVIIVDNYNETEKSEDFQTWKASGKWFPGAS